MHRYGDKFFFLLIGLIYEVLYLSDLDYLIKKSNYL